jgi:hypothetical protein
MSEKPLGFEYQPKIEGSCGAYALGHALNLVGVNGRIETLKNSSSYVSWSKSVENNLSFSGFINPFNTVLKISNDVGTLEKGIVSGIKKNGCNPVKIDNHSKPISKKILDKHLRSGYPIILFVNYSKVKGDNGHWLVCAGKTKGKYIIIDSLPLKQENREIISLYTWGKVADRCINFESEKTYFQLYGFAVQSSKRISAVKKFNKYLNKILKDNLLREWWGYYLNDLVEIFESGHKLKNKITSKNFFNKFSSTLLKNVLRWNEEIDSTRIKQELLNYQLIADTYNLVISRIRLEEALISFTVALTKASRIKK